ncbi:hypothetical protein [Streptomyces gulbargensis]|uniref:hypothetical protein n=1 Tax=Streptomyces gulbargensis TaxID=364901 RepID=UPI0031E92DE5
MVEQPQHDDPAGQTVEFNLGTALGFWRMRLRSTLRRTPTGTSRTPSAWSGTTQAMKRSRS